MFKNLNITIYSNPVPKARPRTVFKNGKIRTYTPQKTKVFENEIRSLALIAMREKKITEKPIMLKVNFGIPVPQSWSQVKKNKAFDNAIKPITRPDLDNYIKCILDGLNNVVFKDDSQVVEITASKNYMQIPKTDIFIKEIN